MKTKVLLEKVSLHPAKLPIKVFKHPMIMRFLMRWSVAFCIHLILMNTSSSAQTVNLSDSLNKVFKNKPKPSLKLDFRNSFISGRTAQIGGIKGGVSFGKTFQLGVGYSWLYSDLNQEIQGPQGVESARVVFRYLGPYVEYSFFRKGPWETMVTANLGYGRIFLDTDGRKGAQRVFETGALVYEPTIGFEYKILNLVGIGAGYGYRLTVRGNRNIEQNFTAPVYVIRFRIILDRFEPLIEKTFGKE